MKRTAVLSVPMTDFELAIVYRNAAHCNLSANDYVRSSLVGGIAQWAWRNLEDLENDIESHTPLTPRVANTLAAALRHARKAEEQDGR